MSLVAAGKTVGLSSNHYDLTDTGGPKGVSHTLTLSTGDGTEQFRLPQDFVDTLGAKRFEALHSFGVPVVLRCTARANSNDRGQANLQLRVTDLRFVRPADLVQWGYSEPADAIDFDDLLDPAPNGHLATVDG